MEESLLNGVRALDLTDQKGFVCGKILATFGIDVIKVEKPGGDPSRNIPPYINNMENPQKSLYWYAFNTDKRSVTLNLEDRRGRDIFKKLVKKSDFIIESYTPGYLNKLRLNYTALSKINPGIIMTSITPFGQTGPHAKYKGSELTLSAMGGVLDNCGDPDRPPLREGPDSIYFRGNAAAAYGSILSYYHRESCGEGQHVDVSLQDVDITRTFMNLVIWEFNRRLIKRSGVLRQMGARGTRQIWPCKDGRLFWTLSGAMIGKRGNQAISDWIDDVGIEDNPLRQVTRWEDLDMAALEPETIREWEAAVGKLFMKYTKKEIAAEAPRRGISLTIVNNPADVLEYPRLKERDYWVNLEHPDSGPSLIYPRHFFLSNNTENYIRRAAPLIGEHNDEIYRQELGFSADKIASLKANGVI
jgi:crotonobetainyl-CoA:carnitine CoA-transferase CaiB-like acyl-CoA transferase